MAHFRPVGFDDHLLYFRNTQSESRLNYWINLFFLILIWQWYQQSIHVVRVELEYVVYNVHVGHIRTNSAIACKDLDLRYGYFSHLKDSLYWQRRLQVELCQNNGSVFTSFVYYKREPMLAHIHDIHPTNTKHLYNIYTMLEQSRRHWADIVFHSNKTLSFLYGQL